MSKGGIAVAKKHKVGAYDDYVAMNKTSERIGWNLRFQYTYPEDVSLGISQDLDRSEIPPQLLEIHWRFLNLGWISDHGRECIFMSHLLRRILRLHGFNAFTKQVVAYWDNPSRGRKHIVGGPSANVAEYDIDCHMVVVVDDKFVLDFALSQIKFYHGAIAPNCIIGEWADNHEYQDCGISGNVTWREVKPLHPMIRHQRLEFRDEVMEKTREYFRKYQF